MFRKRKPKCPITIEDKEWIEDHLDWIDKNVVKIKNQKTILPTKEFFDWTFKGEEKDAELVLRQVGKFFKVETNNINLNFYSEESIELGRGVITENELGKGTAGLYVQQGNKYSILIEVQQLKRPDSLIAIMAHELSHFVLMGQNEFPLEGDENEWLTDLMAVVFGFGIFMGNSKFTFKQWQSGDGWGGWKYSTQGYFPQQITAYAMAEIQMRRSKNNPDWVDYLNNDFRSDFNKSMRFLVANNGM